MKKIFMFLLLGIFMVSFVSAFGEVADFDNTDGEYGSYEIKSGWGILPKFLGGGDLAWVKLTENTDQCLINCYAKGEGYFNEPKNFLDGLEFKNRLGKDETSLEGVTILIGQLEEVINQKPIYKEFCEEVLGNSTNKSYTNCYNELTGYQDYTDEEMIIKEYKGEDIVGDFVWEIKAKKSPGVSVDWVVTIWGERLEEWAWWDTDWGNKRQINLTSNEGELSYLFPINYSASMNSDFSDIRFINNAETTEFNYTIESKTDSVEVEVRIYSQGETSFYLYYGNSGASTTSNASKLYFEPESLFYFDEQDTSGTGTIIDTVENHNGTNAGTDNTTGYIATGYDYVVANTDYIDLGTMGDFGSRIGSGISVAFWTQTTSTVWQTPLAGVGGGMNINFMMRRNFNDDLHVYFDSPSGGVLEGHRLSAGYNDGAWHHIAYTVAPGTNTILFYVDGVNLATTYDSQASPTGFIDFTTPVTIGAEGGTGRYYDGKIDEMRIYNKVLTLSQIQILHNETAPNFTVGAEELLGAIVTSISPVDNLVTNQSFQTFNCNSSFATNISNLTLIFDGADNFTNSTVGTSIELTHSENITTDGIYIWNCRAETVGGMITYSTNRTLTIHTVIPDVTIHDPQPLITYHLLGENLTLNWTVAEAGENLTTHIKNCTYEYNGVVTVLNNTVCTEVNQTSFTYVLGVNNLTFNVTDILDLVNSTTVSWDIKLTEINQTYNTPVTEGSLETFLANIRLGTGYSITGAVLMNYNGSSSIGQSFASGDNTILRNADFLIPNVETDTNITFYWNITLSDSTNLNLSFQNQTILNLGIDNCSSFTNQLFNFTVVDEEEQTILPNATIEVAVNIYDATKTSLILNYSDLFQNINPLGICLNLNVSNSTAYAVDTIVRYEDINHANEYYNMVNQTLNNESTSLTITLYDLNLNDSTEFQLTFTGADFLPIENALVNVDRQYISENVFKTVELPKTDYNGQSVLHLVRNDVIYNIVITKGGVVLGNFENLVAFCDDFTIGDCNIVLNAFDSVEAVFEYNDDIGIIFQQPVYNSTQDLVSFVFVTSDGSAKEVVLEVTRNDIFGNRSVCNASIVSSGATLTCSTPSTLDDSELNTQIYVNDVLSVKTTVPISSSNYGAGGYLIAFVLALTLALLFSGSKTGILFSMILSLAVTIGLGVSEGNLIGLGASGIWLLVIVVIGIYKLNKDRQP